MIKKILVSLAAVLMLSGVFATIAQPALAAECGDGSSIRSGINCAPDSSKGQTIDSGLRTTVNTLLFVVGVAAVIVLIIGGLRFVLAGGNAQSVSSAKDSILYAVIGIVIALLAYAIVNFVLTQFGG